MNAEMIANRRATAIARLTRIIKGRGSGKICVEAGHIYVDQSPGEEHRLSFGIGAEICESLTHQNMQPFGMVLIDDYNPLNMNGFCLHRLLDTATSSGFQLNDPDGVVWEASLVAEAKNIIDQLASKGLTEMDQNGHLVTKMYGVRLIHNGGKISCCALDAALYYRRFQQADFNITILPSDSENEYKTQQRRTRQILRLLDLTALSLAIVYFAKNGEIEVALLK